MRIFLRYKGIMKKVKWFLITFGVTCYVMGITSLGFCQVPEENYRNLLSEQLNDWITKLSIEPSTQGPIYFCLRDKGLRRHQFWTTKDVWNKALPNGLETCFSYTDNSFDSITVEFTYNYRNLNYPAERNKLTNIYRGIRGIEIQFDNNVKRVSPSQTLARNYVFSKELDIIQNDIELKKIKVTRLRYFDSIQLLVKLKPEQSISRMFRGNQIIPLISVQQSSVNKLKDLMELWMLNNLQQNGRMVYKYWPSRGNEAESNNMIRQWMATVCLLRMLKEQPSEILNIDIKNNINYNLKHFYHKEGELGIIEYEGKVKLGAIALAALSILESPFRKDFQPVEESLNRTINELWQENGAFKCFLKPKERNDCQNFYPGEALLYWSKRYEEEKDSKLLSKIEKSMQYYHTWHLEHRNPAFIPWHTQAYYNMWKITRGNRYRDYIFEMNDWLLSVQQWETASADTKGRFYDPSRPFGPPHASSTGVYLEGLIDAFCLARELKDHNRLERYRTAIVRGLRSVMQLQFQDDLDMFYVSKKKNVKGGIRTTVYDNTIRVDNVQHNLMGVLKIIKNFKLLDYNILDN